MSKSWGWEHRKIQLPITNKRSEMEEIGILENQTQLKTQDNLETY